MADLKDNSDLTRIREPQQRDLHRIEKYHGAINIIEQMDEVGTINIARRVKKSARPRSGRPNINSMGMHLGPTSIRSIAAHG
jgi:hypothetical protein